MSVRWQQQPETGQKIWREGIGSGVITAVDYREKSVYVDFYDKGKEVLEFDDLLGNWEDIYGGSWMLYDIEF